MSSLTDVEKRYLEKLLEMQGGYVREFSDATYQEFFRRHKIDIHGSKYRTYGTSKAKKMRAFWEREPDRVVARVLTEILDSYEVDCELHDRHIESGILQKCRIAIARLSGEPAPTVSETVKSFLDKDFTIPNVRRLPVEAQVVTIIETRLAEARETLNVGAHLSVIVLCGSILEGVLLGAARKNPDTFNSSPISPRDPRGKVKPLHEWNLAQFIDVACDIEVLGRDVKTFSHGLREFRNYIHPYKQMESGFTPDGHTAAVCFQVLKAALANLSGER